MKILTISTLLLCLIKNELTTALKLPGPLVYVVTPSPRPLTIDEGRSASRPFYYHNWMRRMDSPMNTTTTSTTTPRVKTPDLIFADFQSNKMKNIRKLLEKERVDSTKSTTVQPIYVPDEYEEPQNFGLPSPTTEREEMKTSAKDMTDYFALYNNLYNSGDSYLQAVPEYVPSSTQEPITTSSSETSTATNNVENIWHIIDSEKRNQYYGGWDEIPITTNHGQDIKQETELEDNHQQTQKQTDEDGKGDQVDDNFALPGFGTYPIKGADNESRAIRTEPNMRFPYVNLQPFQMKNLKNPLRNSNSKKGNNMYNMNNFYELKNPVRGEAQDVAYLQPPVDRYNPAQPYLPSAYGSKSKQSSPNSKPAKAVANLVPPPPPPPPKASADDFPAPVSYESFPPYSPPTVDAAPPSISKPPTSMSPPAPSTGDDSDSDPGVVDLGYRYKPPAPSGQSFSPTVPPLPKPFGGYSYVKPMTDDAPMDTDDNPGFGGYQYEKPAPPKPYFHGYHYEKPAPAKPDFHGYHYSKPEPAAPPMDQPPAFDHGPPSQDNDYPELIYDKPHGGKGGNDGGDDKGADDMKADDMGMVPPQPPAPDMMKPGMDAPPMDDSGFPHDFPGDFDDHDFYHHHHHHTTTTTTTTTTEMPRVNRYSYYYLGKKLYYLPLYFSVYFIIYVAALIIKAVLRHKIVYPNSYRPNSDTASYFEKRSVDSWDLSNENLHEITRKVTHAIAAAAERYVKNKDTKND